MKNRIVVVGGGTGHVGSQLVRSLLGAEAHVVVPTRSMKKAQELRDWVADLEKGRLDILEGDLRNQGGSQKLKLQLKSRYPKIDAAIAAIGGWYQGNKLYIVPQRDWNQVIEDNLTAHFLFSSLFLGIFHEQNEGFYAQVNSRASQEPTPHSGPVSIAEAGQKMLARVHAMEAEGTGIRVHNLSVFQKISPEHQSQSQEELTGQHLGEYLVALYNESIPGSEAVQHDLQSPEDTGL